MREGGHDGYIELGKSLCSGFPLLWASFRHFSQCLF